MNSNIALMLILFSLVACGVKGDPVAPQNPPSPSLLDNYPDIKTEQPLQETKKR